MLFCKFKGIFRISARKIVFEFEIPDMICMLLLLDLSVYAMIPDQWSQMCPDGAWFTVHEQQKGRVVW